MTISEVSELSFTQDWARWHEQHEALLADKHGFLAITSLNWLTDQPQRFPDASGTWRTGPHGVTVVVGEGEELIVDGEQVRGEFTFPYDAPGEVTRRQPRAAHRRAGCRRQGHAGLQPGGEPAVRVHRSGHLPFAAS